MRRLFLCTALALLIPLSVAAAGELPTSSPEAVGLSAETLAKLKPALQELVDRGEIAGGVALIARRGKVAYVSSFGYRDLASKAPMTEDTLFAIKSMGKPITAVATMILVQQGKLALNDPVDQYLPELKDLRVRGDAKDDTEAAIASVPASRPVTVRDLLAQTSGIGSDGTITDQRLRQRYLQAGLGGAETENAPATCGELVERLGRIPLVHQPGKGWTYGLSFDVLGRLIEVVSGERFDRYLQAHLFGPLDMDDTSFLVPEAKRERVATVYRPVAGQGLTALPKTFGSETFFSGGGGGAGLFSTARDYTRFAQMLLGGGALGPVRILQPETIATMTSNQIGDRPAILLGRPVGSYGLGFALITTPAPNGGPPILNRYYWGGYYSTNFWIDPRRDLFAMLLTQVLPANRRNALGEFRRVVDGAIER